MKYSLEMVQMRLGARLSFLLDEEYRCELNFNAEDRIITCYLRCPNSRDILLRNRDGRLPAEILG